MRRAKRPKGFRQNWFTDCPTQLVRWPELLTDPVFSALPLAAQAAAMRVGVAVFIFGAVEDDVYVAARLSFTDVRDLIPVWDDVRRYFTKDDDGNLTHWWWVEAREAGYMRQARAKMASAAAVAVRDRNRKGDRPENHGSGRAA